MIAVNTVIIVDMRIKKDCKSLERGYGLTQKRLNIDLIKDLFVREELIRLYEENEQLKQENNKLQGEYNYLLWLYNGLGCEYDWLKGAITHYDQVVQTLNEKFDKMSGFEELPVAMSATGFNTTKKTNGFLI